MVDLTGNHTSMRLLALLLLCLLISGSAFAQNESLRIPRDVQKLYDTQTRSIDGKPGAKYWLNRTSYQIEAELDPVSGKISGEERIVYQNNSPDTLKQLVIRLYPDILRKGGVRDFAVPPTALHDGVEGTIFIGNDTLDFFDRSGRIVRNGTNLILKLNSPIMPRGGQGLKIIWTYNISREVQIRGGIFGQSDYFVSYWYPQIAVYDDLDGWDTYSYTGLTEFYNDHNDFEVSIKVPDQQIVWATGELQNADEVLEAEFLERFVLAGTSDEVVRIIKAGDYEKRAVTRPNGMNTWRFKAEGVPDFAFAMSPDYLWDAASLVVDSTSGRRVRVDAAYNPKSEDFYEVAEIARMIVGDLSTRSLGVPFPYPEITIFNGGGGMEFPMMVNDESTDNRESTIYLTYHEVAHSYFPFFMGINERKYAWMDEGWATILPYKLLHDLGMPNSSMKRRVAQYLTMAGNEIDMPIITPTPLLHVYLSYRSASYTKPALAYHYLRDLLGEETFLTAMGRYIAAWNGKHPLPYDFFFTFNSATDENLNWYWNAWFFEPNYPDLRIEKVTIGKKGLVQIEIINAGGLPLPADLSLVSESGETQTVHFNPRIWKDGNSFRYEIRMAGKIKEIHLETEFKPDVSPLDNIWKAEGRK
jgi:hypothetical protein